jgi:hypothetical protein
MIFVLFYTTILTPYTVAFMDPNNENKDIKNINYAMNYFFGIDLIL